MEKSPEALELRYLRTYQGFIYEFNMLERNIVYCLAHSRRGTDETATIESFERFSFDRKVRKLKELFGVCGFGSEFEDFFSMVERCRMMRNKIVHGHWEFRDFLAEPIHFHIPEPVAERGSYTFDSFEIELKHFEATRRIFSELREKHDLTALKPNQTRVVPDESGTGGLSEDS